MRSLRELQRQFAATLLAGPGTVAPFPTIPAQDAVERIAVYRRALFANYRNALAATYPVVKRLVGPAFFDTAVDAFVVAHPSSSGDLNVYGDAFPEFLARYPHALALPYLADVAALEWAQDEANRAAETTTSPRDVLAMLAAIPPAALSTMRIDLAPSCRLVASPYPVLRIWQVNQDGLSGEETVSLSSGPDRLLVRREPQGVTIERVGAGSHAWLAALARGVVLGASIEAAQRVDAAFDFAVELHARIVDGTIASARTTV